MKVNILEKITGTFFFTGYFPFAPGTFTSFIVLILFYLIPGIENPLLLVPLIIILFIAGVGTGTRFEKVYGKDPSVFTMDEVVGMLISLLFVPKEIPLMMAAFFIWRAADIIKPYPANRAESIKGGTGIMLDDVIAGIYSLIIMQIVIFLLS